MQILRAPNVPNPTEQQDALWEVVVWGKGRLPGSHMCVHAQSCVIPLFFSLGWNLISKFGPGPSFGDLMSWVSLLSSQDMNCLKRALINCPSQSLVFHIHITLLPAVSGLQELHPWLPRGCTVQQEHVCRGTLSPVSCWQDWAPGRTTKFPCFPGPPGDKTPVWNKKRLEKCWPQSLLPHWEAVHLAQCPVPARLARMQLEDLVSRSLCTALVQWQQFVTQGPTQL